MRHRATCSHRTAHRDVPKGGTCIAAKSEPERPAVAATNDRWASDLRDDGQQPAPPRVRDEEDEAERCGRHVAGDHANERDHASRMITRYCSSEPLKIHAAGARNDLLSYRSPMAGRSAIPCPLRARRRSNSQSPADTDRSNDGRGLARHAGSTRVNRSSASFLDSSSKLVTHQMFGATPLVPARTHPAICRRSSSRTPR